MQTVLMSPPAVGAEPKTDEGAWYRTISLTNAEVQQFGRRRQKTEIRLKPARPRKLLNKAIKAGNKGRSRRNDYRIESHHKPE